MTCCCSRTGRPSSRDVARSWRPPAVTLSFLERSRDGDELLDEQELEHWIAWREWSPLIALPVQQPRRTIRSTTGEHERPHWGAFGTVDHERIYGPFAKACSNANRHGDDLRRLLLTIDLVRARRPLRCSLGFFVILPDRHPAGRDPRPGHGTAREAAPEFALVPV